jgi:hypothetical protein
MQNVYFMTCVLPRQRELIRNQQSDRLLASGQEVRSTRRVGAPSGRCPE